MAEKGETKYIKCCCCKCKYIDDDNHMKIHFGYNKLNERYKTCLKCREKKQEYNNNNYDKILEYKKQYYLNNKDKIHEQRQQLKAIAEASQGKIKYCYRCYKNYDIELFKCPNGNVYNSCYKCLCSRSKQCV